MAEIRLRAKPSEPIPLIWGAYKLIDGRLCCPLCFDKGKGVFSLHVVSETLLACSNCNKEVPARVAKTVIGSSGKKEKKKKGKKGRRRW